LRLGGWGSQMLSCVDGDVVVIVMFYAGADRVCARQPWPNDCCT
jgi:hypothetical protein